MPISEVTTQHVAGKQISEFATEMPASNYGGSKKTIHLVNRALQNNKSKTKTVLEILANDTRHEIIPNHNFILDEGGRLVLPSQVMKDYGLGIGPLRCPECAVSLHWDTIFAHLQGDFQDGHKLSTEKTIDYFTQEFWNWRQFDGHFEK